MTLDGQASEDTAVHKSGKLLVCEVRYIQDTPEDASRTIVDNCLTARRGEITVLIAPPNVGKTFAGLELSVAAASNAHNVLVVSTEMSGNQIKRRCEMLSNHFGRTLDDLPGRIFFVGSGVSLLDPACESELQEVMRREAIAVILLDPLADLLDGADENDAATMHSAMRSIRSIAAASDAAAVLIHHTRKSRDEGRGSSAIDGAADAVFLIREMKSGPIVEVRKQRNAARGPSCRFVLTIDDEHEAATVEYLPLGEDHESAKPSVRSGASTDRQLHMMAYVMRQPVVTVSDLKRALRVNGTDAAKFLSRLANLGLLRVSESQSGRRYAPT
jgi:hypothetical protein